MAKDYTDLAQDIVAHVGGKGKYYQVSALCDAFAFFSER